jgi:histidine triad (HIT) family protein
MNEQFRSTCIFCKIAGGEAHAEKIYETKTVIAFLDINPRSRGHSLVIPKKHIQALADLEDELLVDVMLMVKRIVKTLKNTLNSEAFTIGINDGEEAGQEIPHLHINIIPRSKNDGGQPVQHVVDNPPQEAISDLAQMIRSSN